ncbi:hypothetical protein VTL71DRAFT_13274 [Oculimacula yallundae]|uniref:F-box domain-containing protein n=1 Tax=Oculimacula yallundae TaxID=86028 RepID=A0ABR4CJV7_9HELO
MPLDILLLLTDHLATESILALSFTCKHLCRSLGIRELAKLASEEEKLAELESEEEKLEELESRARNGSARLRLSLKVRDPNLRKPTLKDTKLALLELLAIDLPDQIACSFCTQLHTFRNVSRYNPLTHDPRKTRTPACFSRDLDNVVFISQMFGSTAFKMLMKMYHQQADCSKMLDTMSIKPELLKIEHFIYVVAEECRIFQGRLMNRRQMVYYPREKSSFSVHPPIKVICPHLSTRAKVQDLDNRVTRMIRCSRCRTEYEVGFKDFEEYGPCWVLTRWKDLGSGPDKEVWKAHLWTHRNRMSVVNLPLRQLHENTWSRVNYPSRIFGKNDEDNFRSTVLSLLDRERKSMHQWVTEFVTQAKNLAKNTRFRGRKTVD